MLADDIRHVLRRRPYWGPQSVAKAIGATAHVVRVTASRENIRFMDRYDVEAYADALVDAIEKLEGGTDGSQEQLREDSARQVPDAV
jgi:hypothetical protein